MVNSICWEAGMYYGVTAVEEISDGHEVRFIGDNQPNIRPGTRLVAVINNGVYKIAVDVTVRSEFDHFYGSYLRGMWLNFNLFAFTPEQLEQCPDEGQVRII